MSRFQLVRELAAELTYCKVKCPPPHCPLCLPSISLCKLCLNAKFPDQFFYSTSPPIITLTLAPASVLLQQLQVPLSSSDGGCPTSLVHIYQLIYLSICV